MCHALVQIPEQCATPTLTPTNRPKLLLNAHKPPKNCGSYSFDARITILSFDARIKILSGFDARIKMLT